MYFDLLTDALNVQFLCGVVIWINLSFHKKNSPYLLGVMFGLITIFVMYSRVPIAEGRFYDYRNITMTMAGLVGGPVTASIAAVIGILYRYFLGGSGSIGGIISIIVFGCFGSILGRCIKSRQSGREFIFWFIIGSVMACISIFLFAFISPWKDNSTNVFRTIAAPLLIITPLATTITFNFFFWVSDFLSKATHQLKLEADLSRSNQLIADIINNMPDAFYVLDNQWRFTFVNNKAEEVWLRRREELLGKTFWEIIPQTRGSLCELNFHKAKNVSLPITFEGRCLLNKSIWNQVTAYPSEFGLSVYYRDITEQKLAHEKLITSQKEMSSILESMTDSFFAIDREFKFTYINRAAENTFGKYREELLGKTMPDAFRVNDTSLFHFQEVMRKKMSVTFEILSEALDNKWLEMSAYPTDTGLTCYFRDITNRKTSQAEMARLDRLNLVGQLAAGIAHEIRNPMTTVRGFLQLFSEKPNLSAYKSSFELIVSEIDRANSIITEFLSLAQTKQTALKSQKLNDIIHNLYPILEADSFVQNKQIKFIAQDIPNIELNAQEISQLVLNLARNGLEAMREGGCLTVKSSLQDDKVVLEIADEGSGISPENISKLGTPFFTTKDDGTGLGLATSYKIAESHNAKIRIDSSPQGTTFYISFPIPDKEQDQNDLIA